MSFYFNSQIIPVILGNSGLNDPTCAYLVDQRMNFSNFISLMTLFDLADNLAATSEYKSFQAKLYAYSEGDLLFSVPIAKYMIALCRMSLLAFF